MSNTAELIPITDGFLLAHHHAPQQAQAAVLILTPLGPDAEGAHQALVQLADACGKRKQCTQRFDWRGTGDSSHALSDITPAMWIEDLKQVHSSLSKRGLPVRVIAPRGAGLLLAAAALAELDRVLWWDPIAGADLLADWRARHRHHCSQHGFATIERTGYELCCGDWWRSELLEWLAKQPEPHLEDVRQFRLCHERTAAADLHSEDDAIWGAEALQALVPLVTLRAIVDWICA